MLKHYFCRGSAVHSKSQMDLVVVVPLEPLLEVEILAGNGIRGVEIYIETPIFEPIMELLDLPIVLRMVGFITDMNDSRLGARVRETRAPLPSTIRSDGTDDKGGMNNDVMEEGDC